MIASGNPSPLASLAACLLLAGCTRGANPTSVAAVRKAPSAVQFVDATEKAGIHFTHCNGATGKRYIVETMGSGGAFLDFNGDGRLDILLLNGKPLQDFGSRIADLATVGGREHGQVGGQLTEIPAPTCALYRNNGDGTFTDVTRGSGLDVPMYAMGCCVGDADNDGRDDVYVSCALEPGHLFWNDGSGKFTDVTRQAGVGDYGKLATSCAWVDYDNDGWLDLFVCNYVRYSLATDHPCYEGGKRFYCRPLVYQPDTCTLYHNNGDGTFTDVTERAGIFNRSGNSLGVAVWDFDEDGFPDLVVANDLTPNYVFHNIPASTRDAGPRRPGDAAKATAKDADSGRSPRLRVPASPRRFQEVGLEWGVAFGEDGKARAGMGIDVAEYRNDGRPAILISNFTGEPLSFFLSDGPDQFSDVAFNVGLGEPHLRFLGFGLFFFDYENDGDKDVFVGNGHIEPEIASFGGDTTYAQRPQLYRNRGDGAFEEIGQSMGTPFNERRVTRGAAYGDYDNDGDLDILMMNSGAPAALLRNDGGNREHWLQIELRGKGPRSIVRAEAGKSGQTRLVPGSNLDGIGAGVIVRTGPRTQRDRVRSGSSYCSQSMLCLHFGLGSAAAAEEVEVRWPSGVVDRLHNPRANQRLRVVEGEGQRLR